MRKIALLLSILMVLTTLPVLSTAQESFDIDYSKTIRWDAQYDVIVVGFGGAGAVSAITAAENGSKVLLLEKAALGHEGGNTRYSGQHVTSFENKDDGISYIKAIRGEFENLSDEMIESFVDMAMTFETWYNDHGYTAPVLSYEHDFNLPGGESVFMYYTEMEGADRLWNSLREMVVEKNSDKIDVWYNAPANHLIQDPFTKTVLGVSVQIDGKEINVRAINGIILACGGFETNQEMIADYTGRPYNGAAGTTYNTGDGVKMAQEVGAKLWHMSATSGPSVGFVDPETFKSQGSTKSFAQSHAAVYVGPDGTRFASESLSGSHGYLYKSGTYQTMQVPVQSYMIFDSQSISDTIVKAFGDKNEIGFAKGWIEQADSIESLAETIGINAENLVSTISEWNDMCAAGVDTQFGRTKGLIPFESNGPFYAVKVTPYNLNTQGGAMRDTQCRVLDVNEQPIPQLYSAGEFGSMFPGTYQGGCNLAEVIITGRIAGANAATIKNEPTTYTITYAEQPSESFVYEQETVSFETDDYQYIGTGVGMGGSLIIRVTTAEDYKTIKDIEVLLSNETEGIGDLAITELVPKMIEANSYAVDSVSGATMTSSALSNAVFEAMTIAGRTSEGAGMIKPTK